MQQLISFFYRNKNFLFFVFLEGLAIFFTIQSHSFHTSKFVNSANAITGGIYKKVNSFREFLHLREENEILAQENVYLRNQIGKSIAENLDTESLKKDSLAYGRQKYFYYSAEVINNEFNKSNNYITISSGSKKGIAPDMGVINNKGIVGITKSVSENYATILSVLNVNAKINVKIKRTDHFGTLSWNTKDYTKVQLQDLPIQAKIRVGDTVVTGGKSVIFPKGIPVGVISDFVVESNNYSLVNISLFNDMTSLGYVEVIKNFDKEEILNLEERSLNE
ncbi:rod shape-determining protein MreC [Namhaeicola litoreus]|uniref:Cell shape-determining protein MreC n=1 Tax=Namhaeicola litoreus TaxID=1052145 RepID=A0ABW3Y1Y8_9FLAO